ncbi:MAG: biotin transporter BioY [Alicyclobacillus sp.]|nr:biotin transporter BioY [Alicyclobacillus sp.]
MLEYTELKLSTHINSRLTNARGVEQPVTVRGVVFSALFAALLVVSSYARIDLGFTPVPMTLETLVVMLAGALLGARYGFLSMLLVLVLLACGLPLLGGRGGWSLFFGPSGGYVVSWPLASLFLGWLGTYVRGTGLRAYISWFILAELFGTGWVYLVGVPWLAAVKHYDLTRALLEGCYPFLPGDTLKAVVTAVVAVPLRAQFPPARLTGLAPVVRETQAS